MTNEEQYGVGGRSWGKWGGQKQDRRRERERDERQGEKKGGGGGRGRWEVTTEKNTKLLGPEGTD